MPVPSPPDGIAQVAVRGTYGDTDWTNVFHCEVQGLTGDHALAPIQIAGAFHVNWEVTFLASQSVNLSIVETSALLWADDGTEYSGSWANTIPGEDSGVDLDASVAVVISWRVASHWKGGHPRSYINGIVADRLETVSSFSGDTQTEFLSKAADFRVNLGTASGDFFSGLSLGCLRRFADRGSLDDPPTYLDPPIFVPFTSQVARSHIGSQRRRLGHF